MYSLIKPITILGISLLILNTDCFAVSQNGYKPFIRKTKISTNSNYEDKKANNEQKSNDLINEKSPYLLQHAFNPVNWFAWGEKAFAKARQENKPIFLSIGYSTCHWCHVMARESFENPAIAEILNRYFVSIKVDREERPDLDRIYMAVTLAMTGQGGWPMSVFLTPDLKPFYAGTYFPPYSRQNMVGLSEILTAIQKAWQNDHENINIKAAKIIDQLKKNEASTISVGFDHRLIDQTVRSFAANFDRKHGGFSDAPKFPRPTALSFLLRYYKKYNDLESRNMVLTTLDNIAGGGIYDHIGGGFHRYSVDSSWQTPHFEKMLYDQALLTSIYLEAFQITGKSRYKKVATETLDYVLEIMTDNFGGFYSAEDADSPLSSDQSKHGEGAFYVWQEKEIRNILLPLEADIFIFRFGIKVEGNFVADPLNEFTNKNILYYAHSLKATADKFDMPQDEIEQLIESALKKLKKIRNIRPRPHLDDKVLTNWNGLMISAFAKAYQITRDKKYLTAADRSASFIIERLFDQKKHNLLHRYRGGETGIDATLTDYSFLVQGLLDLYEASFDYTWLNFAETLTNLQIKYFEDQKNGGFYDTSGKDNSVLFKTKSGNDGAEPAGNSIAALNLMRLGQILGLDEFSRKGMATINSFSGHLVKTPYIMVQMLIAYDFQSEKPLQIIVAGNRNSPDTEKMLEIIEGKFLPNKIIMLVENDIPENLRKRLPFIENMKMIDGKATAYICQNYTCKKPTNKIDEMVKILNETNRMSR